MEGHEMGSYSGIEQTPVPRIRLQRSNGWRALNLREFWQYRELLYFLSWRDIKVRYKQTALGALWAILQPFLTMIVFSLFFGNLAKMPSDGIPYPLFVYAGLVPWTYFANVVTQASNSLVEHERMSFSRGLTQINADKRIGSKRAWTKKKSRCRE